MPSAGFEPTIPASERPQTNPLDGAAIGIGNLRRSRVRKRGGRLIWTSPYYTYAIFPSLSPHFFFFDSNSVAKKKLFLRRKHIGMIFAHLAPTPTPSYAYNSKANTRKELLLQFLFLIIWSYRYIIIIIIIVNIRDWTLWSVPSPELQLLSPTFLRSSNCSPSLWSVVVRFQRNSVLWHSL